MPCTIQFFFLTSQRVNTFYNYSCLSLCPVTFYLYAHKMFLQSFKYSRVETTKIWYSLLNLCCSVTQNQLFLIKPRKRVWIVAGWFPKAISKICKLYDALRSKALPSEVCTSKNKNKWFAKFDSYRGPTFNTTLKSVPANFTLTQGTKYVIVSLLHYW